jgi:hypothetical protein
VMVELAGRLHFRDGLVAKIVEVFEHQGEIDLLAWLQAEESCGQLLGGITS